MRRHTIVLAGGQRIEQVILVRRVLDARRRGGPDPRAGEPRLVDNAGSSLCHAHSLALPKALCVR